MVGGGRVCGWKVTWCFYWIEREGENERLDSPKSKKESVNGTLPPLLRLVLLFYVFSSWKDLPLSLLAISVSLPNPPPLSTLTLLIYTTIYCMFFFALLFVKLSLSFPFILSPYTDAVDPSKPLLLIPLRQLLFQPPSRAVAIQHRLLVHTAFPKSFSFDLYSEKKKDGACQSLILS